MISKRAYPNLTDDIQPTPPFNTKRWAQAFHDIQSRVNYGMDYAKALGFVTSEWSELEARQFQNWLKFYQERTHMKYKMAQKNYYENNSPGYFIPLKKLEVNDEIIPAPLDGAKLRDRQEAEHHARVSEMEKQRIIELHRKKIIARLQSARKLLTSDDGKTFAGENWSKLLDALNDLEKQFHTLNKKTVSTKSYEDLIVRQANIFAKGGFIKSSEFLVKMAQGLPGASSPSDPTKSIPDGGAVGNNNPNPASLGPSPETMQDDKEKGIRRFLNLLNGDAEDELKADDDENEDENDSDVEIDEDSHNADDILVVEAQIADQPPVEALLPSEPVKAPAPAVEKVKVPNPEIEVSEKDIKNVGSTTSGSHRDFDSLIDAAFSSLKVSDIVHRLEELSRIFKNREIARQLSVADMMMDKLGLSSFFPTLAEATRSALESNQYCLTRIEEIRNKLSGAMDTSGKSTHDMGQQHSINNQPEEIDLKGPEIDNAGDSETLSRVKDNLLSQEEKEKKKKEIRKSIDEKDLLEGKDKDKANVEGIEQDLNVKPKVEKTLSTENLPNISPPVIPAKN